MSDPTSGLIGSIPPDQLRPLLQQYLDTAIQQRNETLIALDLVERSPIMSGEEKMRDLTALRRRLSNLDWTIGDIEGRIGRSDVALLPNRAERRRAK